MKTIQRSIEAPVWFGVGIILMLAGYGFGDAAVWAGMCAIGSTFLILMWNVYVWHVRRREQAVKQFNQIWSRS